MFSDLTLITLTFNKHRQLLNMLNYWSNTNVTIFILEGSNNSLQGNQIFKKNKNFKYFFLPNISILDRLKFASSKVKSKYILLHHDDDLYFQSIVKKILFFMNKNNHYSSATGLHVNFYNNKTRGIVGSVVNDIKINNSLAKNSFFERKNGFIKKYNSLILNSIIKTYVFKKAILFVKKNNLQYYFVWEVFISLVVIYFGKNKFINCPFFFRNMSSVPIRYDDDLNDINNNLYKWYYATSTKDKYEIYNNFFKLNKSFYLSNKLNRFLLIKNFDNDFKSILNLFYENYKFNKFLKFKILEYLLRIFYKIKFYINFKSNDSKAVNINLIFNNFFRKISLKEINDLKRFCYHLKNL
jgi:glycosyltransferase domain-containing protein